MINLTKPTDKLSSEIAALRNKHFTSTGRNAYVIGAKLRAKEAELRSLTIKVK